jgi:hypothetical protein
MMPHPPRVDERVDLEDIVYVIEETLWLLSGKTPIMECRVREDG